MKKVALILIILGAINWGIVGVLGMDFLGELLGGTYSVISRVVYSVIGIAGIVSIATLKNLK